AGAGAGGTAGAISPRADEGGGPVRGAQCAATSASTPAHRKVAPPTINRRDSCTRPSVPMRADSGVGSGRLGAAGSGSAAAGGSVIDGGDGVATRASSGAGAGSGTGSGAGGGVVCAGSLTECSGGSGRGTGAGPGS